MAPKADLTRLQRDVNFIYAPLRLVLLNFAALDASFDRLKAAHRLQDFTQEAITILRRVFAETMGEEWGRPQIPSALQATHQQLQQDLQQAGGHGQIMQEFLAVANVIGVFSYLIRLRHGYGALRLSHLILTVIAPRLRAGASPERIFQDRPQARAKVKENRAKETAKASVP